MVTRPRIKYRMIVKYYTAVLKCGLVMWCGTPHKWYFLIAKWFLFREEESHSHQKVDKGDQATIGVGGHGLGDSPDEDVHGVKPNKGERVIDTVCSIWYVGTI